MADSETPDYRCQEHEWQRRDLPCPACIRKRMPEWENMVQAVNMPDNVWDEIDVESDTSFVLTRDKLKRAIARGRALERVGEIAQAQVERWYREPPVAEGGDFMADMYNLREALNKLEGIE